MNLLKLKTTFKFSVFFVFGFLLTVNSLHADETPYTTPTIHKILESLSPADLEAHDGMIASPQIPGGIGIADKSSEIDSKVYNLILRVLAIRATLSAEERPDLLTIFQNEKVLKQLHLAANELSAIHSLYTFLSHHAEQLGISGARLKAAFRSLGIDLATNEAYDLDYFNFSAFAQEIDLDENFVAEVRSIRTDIPRTAQDFIDDRAGWRFEELDLFDRARILRSFSVNYGPAHKIIPRIFGGAPTPTREWTVALMDERIAELSRQVNTEIETEIQRLETPPIQGPIDPSIPAKASVLIYRFNQALLPSNQSTRDQRLRYVWSELRASQDLEVVSVVGSAVFTAESIAGDVEPWSEELWSIVMGWTPERIASQSPNNQRRFGVMLERALVKPGAFRIAFGKVSPWIKRLPPGPVLFAILGLVGAPRNAPNENLSDEFTRRFNLISLDHRFLVELLRGLSNSSLDTSRLAQLLGTERGSSNGVLASKIVSQVQIRALGLLDQALYQLNQALSERKHTGEVSWSTEVLRSHIEDMTSLAENLISLIANLPGFEITTEVSEVLGSLEPFFHVSTLQFFKPRIDWDAFWEGANKALIGYLKIESKLTAPSESSPVIQLLDQMHRLLLTSPQMMDLDNARLFQFHVAVLNADIAQHYPEGSPIPDGIKRLRDAAGSFLIYHPVKKRDWPEICGWRLVQIAKAPGS